MVLVKRALMIAIAGVLGLAVAAGAQEPVRTIDIHAKQFEFVPAEITLKKGETVKLELYSDDVPHSLAVEGLPIHAGMEKGHPSEVIVTPMETGDFKGKCAKFCGSGHRDMHFLVHVVN
jgi:cytochrome c oxidase subunit 2